MQNRYKFHIRKKNAGNIEKTWKIMLKEPKGAKREPKGAKREGAKVSQNAYKNRSSKKVSKRVPKVCQRKGFLRSGVLGIFSRCFAESGFQKVLSEIWEPKASQREWKGTVHNSKWSQNKTNTTQIEPYGDQKGAIRRKSCSKIMPRSVRSFLFFVINFSLKL